MTQSAISRITCTLLMGTGMLFLSIPTPMPAQDKKTKIIIDASRDGGTWWFPQKGKKIKSSKPHEGKALADYLKTLSPKVEEIEPGEIITNRLKNASVVVRFNSNGKPYSTEEATAYKDYVENGGRVLLVFSTPIKGSSDAVADNLGIRAGQTAQTPFIKKWAKHPITVGLKNVPFGVGSVISGYPESSIQLGMMTNGQSIFGMATVGEGKVIYLGSYATLLALSQPLTERIFGELLRK